MIFLITLMGMDSFVVLFDSIYLKVLQVKHKIMKFAGYNKLVSMAACYITGREWKLLYKVIHKEM